MSRNAVTFGDFLNEASGHLGPPARALRTGGEHGTVAEADAGLRRVIQVMKGYLGDLAAAFAGETGSGPVKPGPWNQAFAECREALDRAAACLPDRHPGRRWPAAPSAGPAGSRISAAAVSLAAGRDLLQTHFGPGRTGDREHRSEWAPVITSGPAGRALLTELGDLAGQIARHGIALAEAGPAGLEGTEHERIRLAAACRWLHASEAAARSASRAEPVTGRDRDLLRAIPANARRPRRLPDGTENVAELCQGAISCAERVRHHAWTSSVNRHRSPGLTITSLKRAAEAATVTGHHCHLLLTTLEARMGQAAPADAGDASRPAGNRDDQGRSPAGEIRAELGAASEAAARARRVWFLTARSLNEITTAVRNYVSPAAAETQDLALWTGRLAYASPGWNLGKGPIRPARTPEDLAPDEEHLRAVVAAAHYASQALTDIAEADREQISAAFRSGQLLVPARFASPEAGARKSYERATRDVAYSYAARYRATGRAGGAATEAVATVAEAVGSPSRVLTSATAAVAAGSERSGPQETPEPGQRRFRLPEPLAGPDRYLARSGQAAPDREP